MSPPSKNRIEVRLRELAQLFNSMDPSPFSDRDLDAAAEDFIVSWARETSSKQELELVIFLATRPPPDRIAGVEEAVQHYFASRAKMKRRDFRQLMHRGRRSMLVGLLFLTGCFGLGEVAQRAIPEALHEFVKLGLHIVGWVAMWRPLEIFLYDWWPIRSDQLVLERLARMQVRLELPAA